MAFMGVAEYVTVMGVVKIRSLKVGMIDGCKRWVCNPKIVVC